MIEEYENELKELRLKMEAAESFADKLPCFRDEIIKRKLSESDDCIKFGDRYKRMPLNWGVNRYRYGDGRRSITNSTKTYDGHLFNIYINSLNLYGLHEDFGLYEAIPSELFFFCDRRNSTFYVEDETIVDFMEKLVDWYFAAIDQAEAFNIERRKAELRKELESLGKKD